MTSIINDCNELIFLKYNESEIEKKRESIRNELFSLSKNITSGKITRISNMDLSILFQLYDKYFFNHYFRNNFKDKIIFVLSKKLTTNAGSLSYHKNNKSFSPDKITYTLKIGVNFIFKYYTLNRNKPVSGIISKDALEALQLVFEHEICHLIEYHLLNYSSCKKVFFLTISNNIFGHKETFHALPSEKEIAYKKYNLKIGDEVYFKNNNITLKGIINRITKRATVMVPDKNGIYMNKNGERFIKWYVPLSELKKN